MLHALGVSIPLQRVRFNLRLDPSDAPVYYRTVLLDRQDHGGALQALAVGCRMSSVTSEYARFSITPEPPKVRDRAALVHHGFLSFFAVVVESTVHLVFQSTRAYTFGLDNTSGPTLLLQMILGAYNVHKFRKQIHQLVELNRKGLEDVDLRFCSGAFDSQKDGKFTFTLDKYTDDWYESFEEQFRLAASRVQAHLDEECRLLVMTSNGTQVDDVVDCVATDYPIQVTYVPPDSLKSVWRSTRRAQNLFKFFAVVHVLVLSASLLVWASAKWTF